MKKLANQLLSVFGLGAALSIFGLVAGVSAKPYFYTLVELTRASDQVITGTVLEVRESTILIRPIRTHKGVPAAKSIEVERPRPGWEVGIPDYKPESTVLLFTKSTATPIAPIAGPQGLVIIGKDLPAQYETAISKILEYDLSVSTEQRREHIYSMLKGNNPLLKKAAMWDFIFTKPPRERIVGTEILALLEPIALGADSPLANLATSTIGEIGGRKATPILKRIARSPDRNVADTAEIMLRRNDR